MRFFSNYTYGVVNPVVKPVDYIIISPVYSPDRKFIAHGKSDGTISVAIIASKEVIFKFTGVKKIRFSADSKKIFVNFTDKTNKIFDLYTKKEIARIKQSKNYTHDLKFALLFADYYPLRVDFSDDNLVLYNYLPVDLDARKKRKEKIREFKNVVSFAVSKLRSRAIGFINQGPETESYFYIILYLKNGVIKVIEGIRYEGAPAVCTFGMTKIKLREVGKFKPGSEIKI